MAQEGGFRFLKYTNGVKWQKKTSERGYVHYYWVNPRKCGSAVAALGAAKGPWEPTKEHGSQPTKALGSQSRLLGTNQGPCEPTKAPAWSD